MSIERRDIELPWRTRNPNFKITALFDDEYLRNGTKYRHNFNGIL